MSTLTVPAGLVDGLRRGALDALVAEAEEAATVGVGGDRGLLREALERLDGVRGLLDAIGWEEADPPVEVRIDRRHGQATLAAVENEVSAAADRVREAEPPKREATIQQARALREFAAEVQAQVDRLEGSR